MAPAASGPPRRAPPRERPGLLPGGRRRLPHPGVKGGSKTGRSPVDRGRTGSKHHLITDATGISLAATLTGGNRNDVTQLIPLLQAVPPVRSKRGRPRCRPDVVLGDRGYDHDKYRRLVWDLGVKPLIARRGTEHGSGLDTQRRVVERAFAHLHWFRRLRIRWEIRDDIHQAFLTLGCALICWRRLCALPSECESLSAAASRLRTSTGVKLHPTRRGPLQFTPIKSPSPAAVVSSLSRQASRDMDSTRSPFPQIFAACAARADVDQ